MSMTKDEGRALAHALSTSISGAIGSTLDRFVRNGTPPLAPVAPGERKAGTTPLQGKPLDENGAIEFTKPAAVGANGDQFEELYQKVKRRLIDECRVDPILLHLLAKSAPEVIVHVEPRTVELDGSTLRGRLARLVVGGFFQAPRSQADTNRELARTGAQAHTGRLSEAFGSLVLDGILTREGDGFQAAPGLKVTERAIEAR